MDRFVAAGYPFELAGVVLYAFFLVMTRGVRAARFSKRSQVLTLVAAIALVASVPLGYGASRAGIGIMLALAAAALASSALDGLRR